ncbi:MAG: carbohydrate-binding family 9-like protein [Rhodothermales bacterium]
MGTYHSGCLPLVLLLPLLLAPLTAAAQPTGDDDAPFEPRRYVCYRTKAPITMDGRLEEAAWDAVPWTDTFVDIEGEARPEPRFQTRAKMLWDDDYFYVAVAMEEPDVWGTLTRRDTIIFYDNDFEIFIDPDGDTHAYYEFEVNALGTVWDLMLLQPYRDGGPPIDAWDIAGLDVGVAVDGTLNQPGDRDSSWSVEVVLPWRVLRETAPDRRLPEAGEQWRVNFSRVQWHTDVVDGRYVKRVSAETGKALPEDNWVWSPQGVINMHVPERWGYVQFAAATSGAAEEAFVADSNERVKWALRRLYYRQRDYYETHDQYATSLSDLGGEDVAVEGLDFQPTMQATENLYEITAPGFDGATLHLRQDGRVWGTP